MRTRHLILLLAVLVGCSTAPRTSALSAEQAGLFAQRLANEKAKKLYHCQPFLNGAPAQFVQGRWTWHSLQARGQGDMEATVDFEADGAAPKVSVSQLDGAPHYEGKIR